MRKFHENGESIIIAEYILYECGVYRRFLKRDELKQIKETLKLIRRGNYFDHLDETGILIQKAVKNIIAASQAASM